MFRFKNFFFPRKQPLGLGFEEDEDDIAREIIDNFNVNDIEHLIVDAEKSFIHNRIIDGQIIDTHMLNMIENDTILCRKKLEYVNRFDDINRQGANMMERSREWVWQKTLNYYSLLLDKSIEIREFETILLCSHRVLNLLEPVKYEIIVNYFQDLLLNNQTGNNIKAEIADLFIKSRDEILVTIGRNWINFLGRDNAIGGFTPSNIYSHAQNVHSSGIESSVLKTLLNFGQKSVKITPYEAIQQIRKKYNGNINIEKSLDRIFIDTAQFSSNYMKLRDVLNHVWDRIQKHTERVELYKRLGQELEDATGVCSTGYLTRIINVLATYDNDVVIAISYGDEIYASLRTRILALAEREPESVMDGLCLTSDPKDAIDFINRIREDLKTELEIEYKDVKIDNFDKVFEESLNQFFKIKNV